MNKVISGLLGAAIGVGGGFILSNMMNKQVDSLSDKKIDKFKSYYELLNTWLKEKQNGVVLTQYFNEKNIKKIGIYGMGELGNRLSKELQNTDVEIVYAVDKSPINTFSELDVIGIDEVTDNVDAIIVTAIFAMDDITNELKEYVNVPIISLEDVIYSIDTF